MNWKTNLLYVLCATVIMNSLFLSFYLFFKKTRNNFSNRILSLILLVIAIKIGFISVEQQLWSLPSIYFFYTKLAATAYLSLVPIFIIYIDSLTDKEYRINKTNYLLFIPAVIYAFNPFERFFWEHNGLYVLQSILLCLSFISGYKLFSLWKTNKKYNNLNNNKIFNWLIMTQLCILLVWVTAFGAFIYEIIAFYTLLLYLTIKVGMSDFKTICAGWQSRITESQTQNDLIIKLKFMMESEKLYLDSSLTLPKLAQKMAISLHSLSHEINNYYGQNFTEFINTYRITEAGKMLSNELYDNLTIESIAYDCGFNSLSSFNAAFKKQMNVTPSQFRVTKKRSFTISYN